MNKNSVENDELKSAKRTRGSADTDEVNVQLAKIRRAGTNIGEEITSYVKKQPLAAVGIAAGAGFVLGSIFGTRLGRMALVAAAGYAAQELIAGTLGEGGVKKALADEFSKLAGKESRHAS